RIGKTPDAKAQCRAEAVVLYERHYRHATNLEWAGDLVRHQGRLVKSPRLLDRFKHVSETTADLGQRLGISIERDRASDQPVDRAQIVDAMEMVGVRMGHQHSVEPRDTGIEELLAEIRG